MPSHRLLFAILLAPALAAAEPAALPGRAVFTTYCASCHGPEGAGLVGPNLTDTTFLHGGRREDILHTITKGYDSKGMPAWESVLSAQQLTDVADYAFSLIGKNLAGPATATERSTVTPFPHGTAEHPLLMRSFMPTEGLGPDVLVRYHRGLTASKYSPERGADIAGTVAPLDGVPNGLAVNFGDRLSYCFDTTECRLLYTWSGGFMDMTRYWGAGNGGNRAPDYVPVVAGKLAFVATGKEALRITGVPDAAPRFLGYRKVAGVPELRYAIGTAEVTVAITPGTAPGVALCRTAIRGAPRGAVYDFATGIADQISCDRGRRSGTTVTLTADEASAFTIAIAPSGH